MARTIKFALEMKDGVKVRRTLEEIRENFDLKKAMEHFVSGKLAEWLNDRGYEAEAEGLRALDSRGPDFPRQFCAVLGVPYTGGGEVDMEAAVRLNDRRSLLRQVTEDKDIIARAAEVAFTQEELAARLKAGAEVIYLYGEAFTIPLETAGKKYVGVGKKPQISIAAKSPKELAARNILFENVELPENLCYRRPKIAELKQILADSYPDHQDFRTVWLVRDDDQWKDCKECIRMHSTSSLVYRRDSQKEFKTYKAIVINKLNDAIDNSAYTHEKYSEGDIIRCVDINPLSGFGSDATPWAEDGGWCLTKDSLMVPGESSSDSGKIILYKDIISVGGRTWEPTFGGIFGGRDTEKTLRIDYRAGSGEIDFVEVDSKEATLEVIEQLEKYLNTVKDLFAEAQTFSSENNGIR